MIFAKSHIINMVKYIRKTNCLRNYCNLNIPFREFLFCSSVFLWLAITIFDSSNFPNILHLNALRYISIILVGGSFFISLKEHPINIYELFWFIFLCLLSSIVYLFSRDKQLLYILLFIFAARKQNIYTILKIFFYTYVIFTLIVIFSSLVGFTSSDTIILGDVTRRTLGFKHVNYLGRNILCIGLSYIALLQKKVHLRNIFFIVVLGLFSLFYVNSKSAAIVLLLVSILLIFIKLKLNLIKRLHVRFFFLLLFLMSFCFTVFYNDSQLIRNFDSLITNRFYWINLRYADQGFTILGQKIKETYISYGIDTVYPLDNSFVYMLMAYGIFYVIVWLYFYDNALNYLKKSCNYTLMLLFFGFGIYFFVESNSRYLGQNPCWLLIPVIFENGNYFRIKRKYI